MIAEQILDFQIFNGNHVIALNQLSSYFLQVIISNISDLKLVLAFGLSQLLPVGIVVLVYLFFMLMIEPGCPLFNRCPVAVAVALALKHCFFQLEGVRHAKTFAITGHQPFLA